MLENKKTLKTVLSYFIMIKINKPQKEASKHQIAGVFTRIIY